ncbi:hypothetical protein HO173_012794 [Letharia columbiana]|uniref:SET domain-containing protein n=1 Tax=Letharia columbiana TaxID=112416 RepID=A0A8H6CLG0_9LECA|nr:uncharacterized protein HO173_012794 [Letharia columbiana]KAF6225356.1 hypothetical protein HO173_012794 [Letharia columbiana]
MEGQMLLNPAILWGILISECKGDSECGEANEAENGSLDAATTGLAFQEEPEIAQPNETAERPFAGPAILWGILSSEVSPQAMNDGSVNFPESEVLDMDAIVNIWLAAGYDCQLPLEETAASPAVTDAMLMDGGESMQPYQSPVPICPYLIKESPGKGQGVFAARHVVKGERVLVDKPFFVVTKPYNARTVLEEFERMPFARRQQYMQLHCPNRSDNTNMIDVMCIFEANCFNIGSAAAMFLTATRFNHSCLPNIYYSWSEKRDEIVLHSMTDIPKGEEMTICYGRAFCTRDQRQSELRIYNFYCGCPACQTETASGKASESRRLVMKALNDQIIMFQSMLNEALLVYGLQDPLMPVLQLIELIKEEKLHGELMTPYRDAADYLRGRGNFEEALTFAHLELEEEVVCLGNDSDVVYKTIEYIEGLEQVFEKAKGAEMQECEETEELEPGALDDRDNDPTDSDAEIQSPEQTHGATAPEEQKQKQKQNPLQKQKSPENPTPTSKRSQSGRIPKPNTSHTAATVELGKNPEGTRRTNAKTPVSTRAASTHGPRVSVSSARNE